MSESDRSGAVSIEASVVFDAASNMRAWCASSATPPLAVPDVRDDYATETFGVAAGFVDGVHGAVTAQLEAIAMAAIAQVVDVELADTPLPFEIPGAPTGS